MDKKIGAYQIRNFTSEDRDAIARYANNKKIWLNLRDGFPHPYTTEAAERFLAGVTALQPQTVFAIATDTEAIGSIGLMPGEDVHRYTAEMGYWLAEPFWGQGIMTDAVRAVAAYALEELGLLRVYAEPYTSNPASARVLEKAGFQCEGTLRASAFKNGTVRDQYMYSVIAHG